jgi:hypothetical protein
VYRVLFEFLLALAVMFLGIGFTNMISSLGKTGTAASLIVGAALLIVAFMWREIEPHLSMSLRTSISEAASNGYVWLSMLALVWVYLATNSLVVASRANQLEEWLGVPNLSESRVPDSISEHDKEHLKNKLMREDKSPERKVQIIYSQTERCKRFAMAMSEILIAAKWTLVSPPTPAAPHSAMPHGLRVASSMSGPASGDILNLSFALEEVGIKSEWSQDPELRLFDHGFIYVGE